MLCPGDVAVVSKTLKKLEKIVIVIVTVCTASDLTATEAKTKIMYLRTKGMPDVAVACSVEAAEQVYKQAHGSYNAGIMPATTPFYLLTSIGVYGTRGTASGSTPSNYTIDLVLPFS